MTERGASNKSRIELVYRWPEDKIVQVLSPLVLIWAKHSGSFVMGEPNNLRVSPLEILDLEDLFIRQMKQTGISKTEKVDGKYKVVVDSPSGLFTAIINEKGYPERITRVFQGVTTELVYEDVQPLSQKFEDIASKYNIRASETTVNFPNEIKEILQTVSWYTISRLRIGEEQVILIMANHKSGSILKIVYASKQVNVNTEQNEKMLQCNGQGYFIYIITQDDEVLRQIKQLLEK
ncbi:MAG: hypothetical protein ACPLEW_01555 [Pseudothermotoga sp.]